MRCINLPLDDTNDLNEEMGDTPQLAAIIAECISPYNALKTHYITDLSGKKMRRMAD
jgi:hypothetical protein